MTAPRPLDERARYGRPPAPRPPAPIWWTVAEVAARWRVSRMTVYRLVHLGELPARRFGRSYRINAEALAAHERAAAEVQS